MIYFLFPPSCIGLSASTLLIQAGYFSREAATDVAPNYDGTSLIYGWCPRGYYCPEGTPEPIPCPAGTYG